MSNEHTGPCAHDPWQLVGDPIHVVTGACTDVSRDFLLHAPPHPLDWRRHYDSSMNAVELSLGWGHTHSYDHWLHFDVDGLRYAPPAGRSIGFPALTADGDDAAQQGLVLRRISALAYLLTLPSRHELEFRFEHPAAPAPVRAVHFARHRIDLAYDESLRLARFYDSKGRTIRVERGALQRISRLVLIDERDSESTLVAYEYDPRGNLIAGTDPYGSRFELGYDESNRMTSRTDRRGYTFFFAYDARGRCVHSRGEDGTLEVHLRYLENERVTIVRNADGGEWTYLYDETGAVLRTIDPFGGVSNRTLDAHGRTVEEADAEGRSRQWLYDSAGSLIGKRSSSGDLERAYVPRTPIEWELGPLAFSLYRLPQRNAPELDEVPSPFRDLVCMSPDPVRFDDLVPRRPKPLGPPGPPGELTYDRFGNLVRYRPPDGGTWRWHYDRAGNVSDVIDPRTSRWRWEYTSWNLPHRVIDGLGNATVYGYTPAELPRTVTDAGGTTTEIGYDLRNRVTTTRRHGRIRETLLYGHGESPRAKVDADGTTLWSRRPSDSALLEAVDFHPGVLWEREHDELGRLVSAKGAGCHQTRSYDSLGNVVKDGVGGLGVEHVFDGFQLVETAILGRFVVRYQQQGNDHVVVDPTGEKHRFRFLRNGLALMSLSNGSDRLSQYDWNGQCRLKASYSRSSRRLTSTQRYTYSGVGTLERIDDGRSGAVEYEYDAAHRLTKAATPRGPSDEFVHDSAGNLIAGPDLRGVRIDQNRLVAANDCEFRYDARDHVAEEVGPEGTILYRYDARDRLVERSGPGSDAWSAAYDDLGRRTSKTVNGRTTRFVWDRERLMAEIDPAGRVRTYVYREAHGRVPFMFVDYASVDAEPASGKRFFLHTNQIGCPIQVEDGDGSTVWRASIEPYGRAEVDVQSSIALHLRFPGHYLDEETGLHYNRHRYYHPVLGRYLQSDPIDLAGGVNVYAYTSRPLDAVDLDGLKCEKKPLLDPGDDPAFQEKRREAVDLASAIEKELAQTIVGFRPPDENGVSVPVMAPEQMVIAVSVVLMNDGTYKTVVTSNQGKNAIPDNVMAVIGSHEVVDPPRRTASDERFPRFDKRTNEPNDTGLHAEQRAIRYADCNDDVAGVASITPTAPCCPGCTRAIQDRDPSMGSVAPVPGKPVSTTGGRFY